jgi:ADP-ribosylglycohydrolase
MLGAIAGDVIGSPCERNQIKTKDFPLFSERCRFTDDSVMTIAVAHAILEQTGYGASMKTFGRRYPNSGYGSAFFNGYLRPEFTGARRQG